VEAPAKTRFHDIGAHSPDAEAFNAAVCGYLAALLPVPWRSFRGHQVDHKGQDLDVNVSDAPALGAQQKSQTKSQRSPTLGDFHRQCESISAGERPVRRRWAM
jgi:hypothetical protein